MVILARGFCSSYDLENQTAKLDHWNILPWVRPKRSFLCLWILSDFPELPPVLDDLGLCLCQWLKFPVSLSYLFSLCCGALPSGTILNELWMVRMGKCDWWLGVVFVILCFSTWFLLALEVLSSFFGPGSNLYTDTHYCYCLVSEEDRNNAQDFVCLECHNLTSTQLIVSRSPSGFDFMHGLF